MLTTTNIYDEAVKKVIEGAKFSVSFENRSLRINGKYIIKDGKYEGELIACQYDRPLEQIERLYDRYRHSVPSERSDNKRRAYFRALSEDKLSDDDMLYGTPREVAQIELELFILCQMLQNTLQWDDFANGQWFWQSPTLPSLILLKKWFTNN